MSDQRQAKAIEHLVVGKRLMRYQARLEAMEHADSMHRKGTAYHWVKSGEIQDYNGESEHLVYGKNYGALPFLVSLFL